MFNAAVCAAAGLFYLANRLWLGRWAEGLAGWFLSCYANDIWAGLAMAAWLDLLLGLGRLPALRWRHVVPYLLACGFVWECLAPLWKAGAVFDPWDFLAYQAGGLLWLLSRRLTSSGNIQT